jgi:hypothetical protein
MEPTIRQACRGSDNICPRRCMADRDPVHQASDSSFRDRSRTPLSPMPQWPRWYIRGTDIGDDQHLRTAFLIARPPADNPSSANACVASASFDFGCQRAALPEPLLHQRPASVARTLTGYRNCPGIAAMGFLCGSFRPQDRDDQVLPGQRNPRRSGWTLRSRSRLIRRAGNIIVSLGDCPTSLLRGKIAFLRHSRTETVASARILLTRPGSGLQHLRSFSRLRHRAVNRPSRSRTRIASAQCAGPRGCRPAFRFSCRMQFPTLLQESRPSPLAAPRFHGPVVPARRCRW